MNRECARCGRRRASKFFSGPRGRVCVDCRRRATSDRNHARRLQQTYGIASDEYDLLLEQQGGVCAICHEQRRYRLNVDHSHRDERDALEAGIRQPNAARMSVRGLLCRRCNKLLRDARDDDLLLYSASIYLRDWPSEGVIT